jgi:DNA replication protein DnaC
MTILTIKPDDFMNAVKKAVEKKGEDCGLEGINMRISCPLRFKDAIPETLDKRIKEVITKTADTKSFYLYGNIGTGKTYAAYAIAKLYYVNRIGVCVHSFVDLLNDIKRSFGTPDSDSYIDVLLFDKEVFILDDLGAEKVTDWSLEILYRLINKRYERMMPIIITSNLTLKGLSKKYGDRIASRITEMMSGNRVKFTGKDRRMKGMSIPESFKTYNEKHNKKVTVK